MELNTISFNDFVKLANVIWEKRFMSLQAIARSSGLFNVENVAKGTGNIREISEIDLNEYAHFKGEGAQSERAKVMQGYTKFLTSYRISEDIGITYEMRTQNKYSEVVRRLTNLANVASNRMDLDLTHRITFAVDSNYVDMDGRTVDTTVGDGFPLAYTAHTVKGSSITYRNRLAGNARVSRGALEGMERLVVEETINQFGEKMSMPFDIIYSTDDPNTCNTIDEYLKSVASPDAINSGVTNVYTRKYRHVILPRLATTNIGSVDNTKRYIWGLASSTNTTAHLDVWEEPHLKTPSEGSNAEDFATDNWNFGVRAGYGITIVNGSWLKFSSGNGVA
jgi:hypothetical protein